MIPPQVTQQRREEAQAEPTYHCPTNTVQLATVVQELLDVVAELALEQATTLGRQDPTQKEKLLHYAKRCVQLMERKEEVEELKRWLLQFTQFPQASEKEQS